MTAEKLVTVEELAELLSALTESERERLYWVAVGIKACRREEEEKDAASDVD